MRMDWGPAGVSAHAKPNGLGSEVLHGLAIPVWLFLVALVQADANGHFRRDRLQGLRELCEGDGFEPWRPSICGGRRVRSAEMITADFFYFLDWAVSAFGTSRRPR